MSMKEEYTAIDMATAAADGFRAGQRAAQSAGVPDGWALVPKRMSLSPADIAAIMFQCGGDEDAEEFEDRFNGGVLWVGETLDDDGSKSYGLNIACVECLEEGSTLVVEFSPPTMLAAPTVKAEQAQAGADWVMRLLDTGEWHLTRFRNDPSMTEDYCRRNSWQVERQCAPYCGDNDVTFWRAETAEQAFIAAINDLFPERLAEFGQPAPSLPAAGLTDLTAVRCQCCATKYPHDSYDAGFIAGSGMCQVCDAAIPAVDLPSAAPAEQPYPHGIAEDLERSDWAPLEALQWYAAGKHFDVVGGRTRIIDTGAVASNALKHASLDRLELKGDAELSELRAALSAQQSAQDVSVLRETLEDARRSMFAVLNQEPRMKAVAKRVLSAEIERIDRALLNGGEA